MASLAVAMSARSGSIMGSQAALAGLAPAAISPTEIATTPTRACITKRP
jgi:hypothetical protein